MTEAQTIWYGSFAANRGRLLLGIDGAETGWLHLVYANAKGEGALYLDDGSGESFEMEKCDRVPGDFEPSVVAPSMQPEEAV